MKTLIIAIATAFTFAHSANAATKTNEAVSTTLENVTTINKIEVHGNVELYVSNGTTDQVKVYNKYYEESAMVQNVAGVLRISSYSTQKLVVWVSVSDLRTLSVYDNAEVKSFGKLSAIDLDVNLYNKATAQLNMDAFSANITLNDLAKADLTGTVEQGSLTAAQATSVNTAELASNHLVRKSNVITIPANAFPELAIL